MERFKSKSNNRAVKVNPHRVGELTLSFVFCAARKKLVFRVYYFNKPRTAAIVLAFAA